MAGGDSIRNTPAYAGKTALRAIRTAQKWKHPRLRGEDSRSQKRKRGFMETPPLTRGRPVCLLVRSSRPRNTPAYAGKTGACCCYGARCWKHPRLRGEDFDDVLPRLVRTETPPLTRGRLDSGLTDDYVARNTPAYAGKTTKGTTS